MSEIYSYIYVNKRQCASSKKDSSEVGASGRMERSMPTALPKQFPHHALEMMGRGREAEGPVT